jgi:hypothetical protein
MFKNPISKVFIVLAVIVSAFTTLSFVQPSSPKKGGVPVQPEIVPLSGALDLSDYFQRHLGRNADIPVTAANDLSDFYQRHNAMKSVSVTADTSDYFLRHAIFPPAQTAIDTSDYFLRHR